MTREEITRTFNFEVLTRDRGKNNPTWPEENKGGQLFFHG